MTFRTLTAKYPGTCKRCKRAFEAGTTIRYGGPGATWHLAADCPAGSTVGSTFPRPDGMTAPPALSSPEAPVQDAPQAAPPAPAAPRPTPSPIAPPAAPRARRQPRLGRLHKPGGDGWADQQDAYSQTDGAAGYSSLDDGCDF